ncbi:unnamed protein product [Paramecium pentaurelia]|uniref:Ubiquitinyl hydrolase 1 n=2 Tax=Paramecium pentaurelia TaxID=43138 RepID=A0A8S1V5U8_9CILI|nr:unnamed protein product [Paramecium pentaurelia]
MFICCNTKPKQDKSQKNTSTTANSDVESIKQSKCEEQIHKEPVQDTANKQLIMELNQKDKKLQEIQNIVNRIKSYREEGKLNLSIDIEKSFVTSLIEEDIPTLYFVEYKWAVNYTTFLERRIQEVPKKINNTKLLTEDNAQKELIIIKSQKDSQLLPGLQPDKHYVLLNERSWTFIHLLYGGGPKIIIDLEKPVTSPDIINDGQTNVTSNTANTTKLSIEPLIDIAKLEYNNLDDSDKSPNTNTTRRPYPQKTNIIKIEPKPYELPYVGLQNPKYYCYMNSALQCLLSIRELNDSLLKQQKQSNKKFTMAYQDLLRLVQSSIPGSAISVEKLQNMCLNKFKYSQQQDAHEFLLYLLSEIQQELVGKNKYQKEEFQNALEAWDVYRSRNPDIITDLFAGQIASKSHCLKCKEISEGFDPILDLNLPLSKYYIPREFKLQDCLQNYFKEEQINDAWKCDKCQFVNKSVLRKIQITQTPKYLILHLKRFTQFPKSQKITDEVTYPEILDIKQFCAENVEYTKYTLKGVISHMGQLNGGHYVAYAQRQNTWYHFDDNIVTKDKNNQHLSDKGAYIIFYEQL